MFASDRDIKKPSNARRGGGGKTALSTHTTKASTLLSASPHLSSSETTTHGITSSSCGHGSKSDAADVVEQARIERQRREALRTHAARALRLQAWWRGRRSAQLTSSGALATLGQRIGDLERVATMLRASKGIEFVPPMPVAHQLITILLFLGSRTTMNKTYPLIPRLCISVLLPSLRHPSREKNVLAGKPIYSGNNKAVTSPDGSSSDISSLKLGIANYASIDWIALRRLVSLLITSLSSPAIADEQRTIVLDTLRELIGCKSVVSEGLQPVLCKNLILHSGSPQNGWCADVRKTIINLSEPFLKHNSHDETAFHVKYCDSFRSVSRVASVLFSLTLSVVEAACSAGPGNKSYELLAIQAFVANILACPALSTLLDESAQVALRQWTLRRAVVNTCSAAESGSLAPSPLIGFSGGHWLLGNLAGLCIALTGVEDIGADALAKLSSEDVAKTAEAVTDDLLLYLRVIQSNFFRFYIPGIFRSLPRSKTSIEGSNGIMWVRSGVELLAVGVPALLRDQLLELMRPDFMKLLFDIALAPFNDDLAMMGTKVDREMIAKALSSNAVAISKQSVIESTEASNSWFGGKWAKKLTKAVSGVFQFGLNRGMDASSISLEDMSAIGGSGTPSVLMPAPLLPTALPRNQKLVSQLCLLWSVILPQASISSPESMAWRHLSSLAFSTHAVDRLWVVATKLGVESFHNKFDLNSTACISSESSCSNVLISLAALLNVALIALDDKELYEYGHPLPLDQILKLIKCFKMILFLSLKCDPSVLAEPIDASTAAVTSNDPLLNLDASMQSMNRLYRFHAMKSILACLQNLFVRWVRRPFSYADLWEIEEATSRRFLQALGSGEDFARSVIAHIPWCIPFHQRMVHIRTVLDAERQSIQGSDSDPLYRSRGTVVSIRRAMVLEDGMQSLARVSAAGIKDRIVVRYINEFGEEEKGIDAGGLFKDFWNDLSRFVFDPSFGLFAITSDNLLYPNPNSVALYSKEELEKMYFFVGRILGKALFENLTVQPQFTHFFLAFISGRYNFMNLIDDLATLDAELYKNLMFLKAYEGDIEDLALTFTVSENAFGSQKDVDLIPGGANIDVTRQNRHRYINAVAKYYLHDRIFIQARSFFMGLHEVIRPDLLNMFCAPELQVLISGTSTGVSFDDLKANTHYASGYHALDRTISMFWAVVKDMSESDRALLLKFVTSCERPPSMGFSSLHPPFTVQRVPSDDDSRLPTASTCFNVLKLPSYSSQTVLRDKLLLAIRSKSGFDLS